MPMDAIQNVNQLVKEYLLFLGYSGAYQAFCAHEADDARWQLPQPESIAEMIRQKCKDGDIDGLISLWNLMSERFFSKMPQKEFVNASSRELFRALQRCMIIDVAITKDRAKLQRVFDRIFQESPLELTDPSLGWTDWLAIPFCEQPSVNSRLAPFFTPAWRSAIFTALHNFLSTVFSAIPLPSLLHLHSFKERQRILENEKAQLQNENERLLERLAAHHRNHVRRISSTPALSTQLPPKILLGHTSEITSCRFSYDGEMLASSSLDATIRIWKPDGSNTPISDTSPCYSLEWDSRSSRVIFYGNAQGKLKLWNAETKRALHEMHVGSDDFPRIISIATSPSDSICITSCASESMSSGSIGVWSYKTGKNIMTFATEPVSRPMLCTVFNHNGTLCAMGSIDGYVRIFDLRSKSVIVSWQAHTCDIQTIAFGADETTVISCGLDSKVIEWDLHRHGQALRTINLNVPKSKPSATCRVDFSCDDSGKQICITNGVGNAVVYNWEDTSKAAYVVPLEGSAVPVQVDWSCAKRLSAFVLNDNSIRIHSMPVIQQ